MWRARLGALFGVRASALTHIGRDGRRCFAGTSLLATSQPRGNRAKVVAWDGGVVMPSSIVVFETDFLRECAGLRRLWYVLSTPRGIVVHR